MSLSRALHSLSDAHGALIIGGLPAHPPAAWPTPTFWKSPQQSLILFYLFLFIIVQALPARDTDGLNAFHGGRIAA